MSRTTHTMTIRFTRQPQSGEGIPPGDVDLDIEAIEIDGDDIVMLTTKPTQAEVERAIYNALNILEG